MTDDRTGSVDPARTLALLWREPGFGQSVHGPKQALSVDRIVTAAVELADAAGLESLSMRKVAHALGVSAMSLYTYVPGKAELLDLMLDAVYLQMPRATMPDATWRDRLRAVADENRALYLAHPWLATVPTARPPLGPGLMAKYEHELSAFENLGLDDVAIDDALTYLLTFVGAAARGQIEATASQLATSMTDEEWWAANAPILARVFDPETYPAAVRIGSAAGAANASAYDPAHAYDFGLSRVLDGLAVLVDRSAPEPPPD